MHNRIYFIMITRFFDGAWNKYFQLRSLKIPRHHVGCFIAHQFTPWWDSWIKPSCSALGLISIIVNHILPYWHHKLSDRLRNNTMTFYSSVLLRHIRYLILIQPSLLTRWVFLFKINRSSILKLHLTTVNIGWYHDLTRSRRQNYLNQW